jgi:hypothetical protein
VLVRIITVIGRATILTTLKNIHPAIYALAAAGLAAVFGIASFLVR